MRFEGNDVAAVECVLDARARLGESPVWCDRQQVLYWADLLAPALHRFDPASGDTRSWPMPETVGSMGLCQEGSAVVALRSGFHRFDFDTECLTFLAAPDPLPAGVRFNDGKVSPDGRFFFAGTMDEVSLSRPIGGLYRLDSAHRCQQALDGLVVSNGLAWSPDGGTLFHSDSRRQRISTYRYDARTGGLANSLIIARPSAEVGRPDGGAVDAEGFYWSAGVSAGVLNRWSPAGELVDRIATPCVAPTMPCFGGPDLCTLYITSLTPEGGGPSRGMDGGLFALRVTTPGVPVGRFRG